MTAGMSRLQRILGEEALEKEKGVGGTKKDRQENDKI